MTGREVREYYIRILDMLRSAQETTGRAHEGEGAGYASFVVGRERDRAATPHRWSPVASSW